MNIILKPRKVTCLLLVLAFVFTLAHIAGKLAEFYLGRTFGLFIFDFDQEQSIPRLYSTTILLLCSGLLLIIAVPKLKDNNHSFYYWLGLAIIFLFLAIMKSTAFHENLALPIWIAFNISKIQFYACVYGAVALILPVLYLKFLLSIPRRMMVWFVIGGSIYVAGAFGLDLVVAGLGNTLSHQNLAFIGLDTLEEVLEMVGIIVIVYSLLLYMSSEFKWIRVGIVETEN